MTTTDVSTISCVLPDWFNDTYCDDENNLPDCLYDGGDCCQENPPLHWDQYCQLCECLEGITEWTPLPCPGDGTCNYPNGQCNTITEQCGCLNDYAGSTCLGNQFEKVIYSHYIYIISAFQI